MRFLTHQPLIQELEAILSRCKTALGRAFSRDAFAARGLRIIAGFKKISAISADLGLTQSQFDSLSANGSLRGIQYNQRRLNRSTSNSTVIFSLIERFRVSMQACLSSAKGWKIVMEAGAVTFMKNGEVELLITSWKTVMVEAAMRKDKNVVIRSQCMINLTKDLLTAIRTKDKLYAESPFIRITFHDEQDTAEIVTGPKADGEIPISLSTKDTILRGAAVILLEDAIVDLDDDAASFKMYGNVIYNEPSPVKTTEEIPEAEVVEETPEPIAPAEPDPVAPTEPDPGTETTTEPEPGSSEDPDTTVEPDPLT